MRAGAPRNCGGQCGITNHRVKTSSYLRTQWLEIEGGVDWRQQGRDAAVGKGADGGGDDARERRRGWGAWD